MFSARNFSQQQYKDLPRFVRQALTVFGHVEKRNERDRKKIVHHAEQQLEQTQQNNVTQQSIVNEQRRTVRLLDQLIQAVRSKRSGNAGVQLPGLDLNRNNRAPPGKIRRLASRVGSTLLGGAASLGALFGVGYLTNSPDSPGEALQRAIAPLSALGGEDADDGEDPLARLQVLEQLLRTEAGTQPAPPQPEVTPVPPPSPTQNQLEPTPSSSDVSSAPGSTSPVRLVSAQAALPGASLASHSASSSFTDRVLRFRAREIEFKADTVLFGNSNGSPAPSTDSRGNSATQLPPPSPTGASTASPQAGGLEPAVQQVIQRVQIDFPGVEIISGHRPHSHGSQHQTGRAVDLSLRQLNEQQRAQLVENLTTGRYGDVGGLGMYNARGDTIHIDVRQGQRQAWGPNHSRTSLHQTPLWFQSAVVPWQQGQSGTTAVASVPGSGAAVHEHSQQEAIASANPPAPAITVQTQSEAGSPGSFGAPGASIDPDDPGPVEPADAAMRYARLFGLDVAQAA